MYKIIAPLFIILLFVLEMQTTQAQGIRKYSNEFLSLGVGAKALGMGNAQVASTTDVYSGYWNPAGLTHVKNLQVAAMHAEWFAGIAKYDYISVAMPLNSNNRSVGLSAIRLGVDDIPNTLQIVDPDGNINYDNITTFSAADYAFLLSYAQKINKFRVGANVKIVHRRVGKFATAWGFGLDVGAKYAVNKNLMLGLTIKDLTTTINSWSFNFTDEEKEILALTDNVIPVNSTELTGQRAILGAAYKMEFGEKIGLLAELDLDFTFDGKRNVLIKSDFMSIDPHLGLELNYDRFVFLRAGFNNIQQYTSNTDDSTITSIQPNIGLGLKIKEIRIDYAFTGLNRLSDGIYSHVFSLLINFRKNANNNSEAQ